MASGSQPDERAQFFLQAVLYHPPVGWQIEKPARLDVGEQTFSLDALAMAEHVAPPLEAAQGCDCEPAGVYVPPVRKHFESLPHSLCTETRVAGRVRNRNIPVRPEWTRAPPGKAAAGGNIEDDGLCSPAPVETGGLTIAAGDGQWRGKRKAPRHAAREAYFDLAPLAHPDAEVTAVPPFLLASSLPCYFRAGDVAGDYGAAAGMLVNRRYQETTPLAQLGAVIGSDTSPTVFKWDGGDGCACLKGGIGTPVGFHQVDHHLCPPMQLAHLTG